MASLKYCAHRIETHQARHTHTQMLTHGWIAVRYVGDGICTPLTRGFLCGRCVGMRRYLLLILNIVILLLVIHVGKCISTTTRRTNKHTHPTHKHTHTHCHNPPHHCFSVDCDGDGDDGDGATEAVWSHTPVFSPFKIRFVLNINK